MINAAPDAPRRVAVIGAGLAGLTAAAALAESGVAVCVYEKSRGLGGRLASRRPFGRQSACVLDHGAPAAEPACAQSAAALSELGAAWPAFERGLGGSGAALGLAVTAPSGNSALVKPLAAGPGLRVTPETEITDIARGEDDFLLRAAGQDAPLGPFDAVISAVPAPQAAALLGGAAPASCFDAEMRPVLTVMAIFDAPIAPADAPALLRPQDGPLELIVRDSAKPGRASCCAGPHGPGDAWVGHASRDWSEQMLDADKDEIAARLLGPLTDAIGARPGAPVYLAGHRWRYAYAVRPQGQAYWLSEDGALGVCGDWRLGPVAGAAWRSGRLLGQKMAAALRADG